jgi:hypothetical protein
MPTDAMPDDGTRAPDESDGSDRDRDESGRARNARPRDGLGRPLPYGTAGFARPPEGVSRAAEETIALAQQLLDEGGAFYAHEVFEDAWKSAEASSQGLWKGLAQLAVGMTHAARGNAVGAASLLRRAAATVEPFEQRAPYGLAVAELRGWALQHAAELDGAVAGVGAPLPAPLLRGGAS